MRWYYYPWALAQAFYLIVLRVVLILAGFIVVPIAMPFRTIDADTAKPFTEHDGVWMLVTLPRWAWLWSNDRDGAMGDERGWWHANAPFGLGAGHWFSQLVWLAFRNPANNARFTRVMGCPVTETTYAFVGDEVVKDKPGMGGMRFLVATHKETGRRYFGFYGVKPYNDERALVVQIGFKGEPSDWVVDYTDDETRQWKGLSCEINPWKNIA